MSLFPLKDTEGEIERDLLAYFYSALSLSLSLSLVFTENAHPIGQTRQLLHLDKRGLRILLPRLSGEKGKKRETPAGNAWQRHQLHVRYFDNMSCFGKQTILSQSLTMEHLT